LTGFTVGEPFHVVALRDTGDEVSGMLKIPDRVKRAVGFEIGPPFHGLVRPAKPFPPRMLNGRFAEDRMVDQKIADLHFDIFTVAHRDPGMWASFSPFASQGSVREPRKR